MIVFENKKIDLKSILTKEVIHNLLIEYKDCEYENLFSTLTADITLDKILDNEELNDLDFLIIRDVLKKTTCLQDTQKIIIWGLLMNTLVKRLLYKNDTIGMFKLDSAFEDDFIRGEFKGDLERLPLGEYALTFKATNHKENDRTYYCILGIKDNKLALDLIKNK